MSVRCLHYLYAKFTISTQFKSLSPAIPHLSIACSKDSSSSLRNLHFLSVYSALISTYPRFIGHSKTRSQF